MLRALVLIAALSAQASEADSPLQRDFPSGSIRTREQAASASLAARGRAESIDLTYKAESERCATVVLVKRCLGNARRIRDAELREVERVNREARDVVRKLDAQERAGARAAEDARRAAQAPANEQQATRSREAYQARQKAAEKRKPQGAPSVKQPRTTQGAPAPELSAAEREENVRRLQEKQRAAAEYAKSKAAERAANELRRERRRQEKLEEMKRAAEARTK
jgi:hypothetical protein